MARCRRSGAQGSRGGAAGACTRWPALSSESRAGGFACAHTARTTPRTIGQTRQKAFEAGVAGTRYQPAKPPGEVATILLDYAAVLPAGRGLSGCTVTGYLNQNPPVPTSDLIFGTPLVRGRLAWCSVSGGVAGTDYQVAFSAADTAGNTWPRRVLWLCADTS